MWARKTEISRSNTHMMELGTLRSNCNNEKSDGGKWKKYFVAVS